LTTAIAGTCSGWRYNEWCYCNGYV
jgi:hypothetical protein